MEDLSLLLFFEILLLHFGSSLPSYPKGNHLGHYQSLQVVSGRDRFMLGKLFHQ